MGLLSTIREHSAIARGNFATIFKDAAIPPLPAAVSRLLEELNRPEPDFKRLGTVISADPEMAAKVLRTVNSALFALRHQVLSVTHAITLLGLERIRSLLISYAMKGALPRPTGGLFDHEAFWTDSLLRALLARTLTARFKPGEQEEAFTAALLADVAVPVLLTGWGKYFEPVVTRWTDRPGRLSDIEREDFGWDHGQAGAWILQNWSFPEELVCMVGSHNLGPDQVRQMGLEDTIALPIATAALLPSVLKPDPDRCRQVVEAAIGHLAVPPDAWPVIGQQVQSDFLAIFGQFDLTSTRAGLTLDALADAISARGAGP